MDLIKRITIGIAIGAAALTLGGTAIKSVHDTDRKMYAEWCEKTNTLPIMIAQGRTTEAWNEYKDAWADINAYSRSSRRDPISFVSSREIEQLENTLNWESLLVKAKSVPQTLPATLLYSH